MEIKNALRGAFSVIGEEDFTNGGEWFIQRFWNEANSHFAEIEPLPREMRLEISVEFGGACWISSILSGLEKKIFQRESTLQGGGHWWGQGSGEMDKVDDSGIWVSLCERYRRGYISQSHCVYGSAGNAVSRVQPIISTVRKKMGRVICFSQYRSCQTVER